MTIMQRETYPINIIPGDYDRETFVEPTPEDVRWWAEVSNADPDATADFPPVPDEPQDFIPPRVYEGKVSALLLSEGFPRALLGAVLLHLAAWGTAEGCSLLSPIEAAWVEPMLPMAHESAWLAHDGYRWEA